MPLDLDNVSLGICGAIFALIIPAIGSTFSMMGIASTAIGAWKRNYLQGKPASFMLVAFVGVPLSNTIYGMILMFQLIGKATLGMPWPVLWFIGLVAGVGIGLAAWLQGKSAAVGADAVGETNKGFVNAMVAIGCLEVLAIFIMVFSMIVLNAIPLPATPQM